MRIPMRGGNRVKSSGDEGDDDDEVDGVVPEPPLEDILRHWYTVEDVNFF